MARKLLKDANWNTAQTVTFNDTAPVAGAAPNPIADAEFAAYQQWLGDIGMKVEQKLSPDSAAFSDLTLKATLNATRIRTAATITMVPWR